MIRIKSLILVFCLVLGSSCTLDLLEDPNNVQTSEVRPTLLLNSMQRSLAVMFQTTSTIGMQMTRLQNSGGTIYVNVFTPQSFDNTWTTAYAGILQDGKAVIEYSEANGWARHAGIAKIINAYTLLTLVDFFGDVPYSQALDGLSNLNPTVDDMAVLYNEVIALLDDAKLDLNTAVVASGGYLNPLAEAPTDLYYANNYGRWTRLANTLKLKVYLNLRLTDPTRATTEINALIADATATGGFINAQSDNFAFRYGTNLSDPDSRHPRFVAMYPAGGGNYMSNYLMWQMFHGYDAQQNGSAGDPRIRFYFYRQTNANNTDPNNIRCVTATTVPAHYPQKVGAAVVPNGLAGMPPGISTDPNNAAWSGATGTLSRTFCFPTSVGYWGRDHVNPEGIPPDNLLRTAWGVYPAGGRFDNNVNQGVNATTRGGMFGAGIQPIMMRSFVQFMLAEAALTLGTTGTTATYFANGMNFSFTDVRDWSVNGTFGVGTPAATEANIGTGSPASVSINTFYPAATYTTDVAAYVTAANTAYAAAGSVPGQLNYIAREYWVALFGNGVEAYNLYRRTGMPSGMQPTLSSTPGQFPRSFFYPNNFATLNSTVDQKADLTGKIFWDNTTTDLGF